MGFRLRRMRIRKVKLPKFRKPSVPKIRVKGLKVQLPNVKRMKIQLPNVKGIKKLSDLKGFNKNLRKNLSTKKLTKGVDRGLKKIEVGVNKGAKKVEKGLSTASHKVMNETNKFIKNTIKSTVGLAGDVIGSLFKGLGISKYFVYAGVFIGVVVFGKIYISSLDKDKKA